jgi:hypothetical protein
MLGVVDNKSWTNLEWKSFCRTEADGFRTLSQTGKSEQHRSSYSWQISCKYRPWMVYRCLNRWCRLDRLRPLAPPLQSCLKLPRENPYTNLDKFRANKPVCRGVYLRRITRSIGPATTDVIDCLTMTPKLLGVVLP